MCGRVVRTHSTQEIAKQMLANDETGKDLPPDFNVGPTRKVPVVHEQKNNGGKPERVLSLFKWGLVPSWAKDPSIGNRMINARVETVAEKPSFRSAFKRRRAIVPISGFYEWQETTDGKQPWFIHPKDNGILALAGIFEHWKDAEGQTLTSFAIITTSAADDVGELHDRAPLIVPADTWEEWLDPDQMDTSVFQPILLPAVPGTLDAYKVDKAVGNVRNNYPELLNRLPD